MAVYQLQVRRDSAANWTANNPTLSTGEPGYETDDGGLKIGDGSTAWTALSYVVPPGGSGVTSVNGESGVVVLDTTDIAEGTNLYYTDARADARIAATDTDSITQGVTNLYYADSLARGAISVSGDLAYDSANGIISFTQTAAPVDSVNGNTGAVVLSTTDISEGTNLYHTDARSRASISVTGDLSYDSGTGVISFTETAAPVDSVNGNTGAVVLSTTDISEGTNEYFTTDRANTAIGAYDGVISPGTVNLDIFAETVYDNGNISGAYDFSMVNGSIHQATLTGDLTTASIVSMSGGASATLILTQDGTGTRTATWGAAWRWAGGNSTLSTDPGATDIVSVFFDGTNYFASLTTGYVA